MPTHHTRAARRAGAVPRSSLLGACSFVGAFPLASVTATGLVWQTFARFVASWGIVPGVTVRSGVDKAGSARRRPVTLHDVAREAGVAVSTVSRALADPDRVNVRTREHVRAVAEQLGYRPNRLARALHTGRTRMLAI